MKGKDMIQSPNQGNVAPLVRTEKSSEHVGLITLDSPPRNAFGSAECNAFAIAFEKLENDASMRCVVITGTGKSFIAGANLREEEELTPDQFEHYLDAAGSFGAIMAQVEESRLPVIAAINGYAVGGGLEFALCCDIRLASIDAKFVCAGVNVGLILSWFRLPKIIGLGRAKEMLLTGKMYDAECAEQWGLVSGLFAPDALVSAAISLAERVASRAPLSVEATKECANRAFDLPTSEALQLQRTKFLEMVGTQDHAEALRAFLEKRPANYARR